MRQSRECSERVVGSVCTFGTALWGKRHCDGPTSHGSWPARQVHTDFTGEMIVDGKVAFEEHFAIEDTLEQSRSFAGDSGVWDDFTRQLLDLDSERLGHMDAAGIE